MELHLSSESTTVAAPRGISMAACSRYLTLSVMAVLLLFAARNTHAPAFSAREAVYKPFSQLIELEPAHPQAPSAFENELAMSRKQLLDRWDPLVAEAAQRFHIPADWLRAVMQRESGGRTMLARDLPIVSNAGAMGIMQLMPGTYGQMARQYGLGDDPFNPRDSVFAAAGYLRWLHGRYGFPAMFAAYNDGPGNYEDHLKGRALPAETRNYLKAIATELGQRSHGAVKLTRPDGSKVAIDVARVNAVRAALPGEYARSVHAVIDLGRSRQGVREDVAVAESRLRQHGAAV
jgi:soluble lytic murein transglycosylase-like protein